jgi:hypothetical protein
MKRRAALGFLGGSALAPAIIGRAAQAATPIKLDPQNPDHVKLIHRKLCFSMDTTPTFVWLRATRFGLVDSRFTPFWEMHVGQAFTTKDMPDGSYEVAMWSAIFYTDVNTGKFIETFRNPYTGKEVPIRYNAPRVMRRLHTKDGEAREPMNRPEMNVTMATGIGPAWIEGDAIWVRGDISVRLEPKDPKGARLSQVNDWSTFYGTLKDVANPDNKNPASTWIFNDINTWPAWLEMGDQPGNYVSRGLGQKEYGYDAMPAQWRGLVAQRYPDFGKDPVGALKG